MSNASRRAFNRQREQHYRDKRSAERATRDRKASRLIVANKGSVVRELASRSRNA